MFCGNCGKQIAENALTCPFCNWVVSVMPGIDTVSKKVSAEKEILIISERVPELTLTQIVTNTNLEMDEAQTAIKNLVAKGIAKETVNETGQTIYTFNNEALKVLNEKRAEKTTSVVVFIIGAIIIVSILNKCING